VTRPECQLGAGGEGRVISNELDDTEDDIGEVWQTDEEFARGLIAKARGQA
jgi:hypothetical protein